MCVYIKATNAPRLPGAESQATPDEPDEERSGVCPTVYAQADARMRCVMTVAIARHGETPLMLAASTLDRLPLWISAALGPAAVWSSWNRGGEEKAKRWVGAKKMHDLTLGFLIGEELVGKEAFPRSESTIESH